MDVDISWDNLPVGDRTRYLLAYKSITDTLLQAGYYRVRIKTLSKFDKVVGGLCWAITASGEKVEVDLFFQENSSIGQRIKLSENIVKALRLMKCPDALQAHQIHGGDFPALKRVIVWLVQRVSAVRASTGDFTRIFSERQYRKIPNHYSLSFLDAVAEKYKPVRRHKIDWSIVDNFSNQDERVRSCLLEYGEGVDEEVSFDFAVQEEEVNVSEDLLAGFERHYLNVTTIAKKEEAERHKKDKIMEMELRGQMSESKTESCVSETQVNKIVGIESNRIKEATKNFMEQGESTPDRGGNPRWVHANAVTSLKKTIRDVKLLKQEREKELNQLRTDLKSKMEELTSVKFRTKNYEEGLLEVEAYEISSDDRRHLNALEKLVKQTESLKKQEKDFRQSCKKKLKDLQAELSEPFEANPEDEKKYMEIESMHAKVRKEHTKARKHLAKKSQQLAVISRMVDDIPTRSELIQYERRFVELYEELATKLEENRRHVSTYNTLKQVHELLVKEESLLQSVIDSFSVAMKSSRGKEEFISQISCIVDGLKSNLKQAEKRKAQAFIQRDERQQDYQQYIEKQRDYFKAVKDLQRACELNEELVSQFRQQG
mmetsp:Transcript_8414/g.10966  ORF Transcript_8414/g.10966 Transcript_8414/m.10966 type:complete len:601 (-) Transcript_8414:1528-3330(-)|eukprot:CAMPEP_0184018744 /NCGR_PEP_ID=MMETSP0954-20121128/8328_1 /TAXON_ID=627963 /ORGANISM="Aplanochytrium sp, Strain PBS07" /LENGTH=600 /DNA_ID=CAMNT_0026300257 /DNA_START=146 /DNA_END=1948 /DNA_ORIENTATION=+